VIHVPKPAARFYREALAGMRARNLPMWIFSAIDEKWKVTTPTREVEAHWGFFTSAREPQGVGPRADDEVTPAARAVRRLDSDRCAA
jgi:hypothetical protein